MRGSSTNQSAGTVGAVVHILPANPTATSPSRELPRLGPAPTSCRGRALRSTTGGRTLYRERGASHGPISPALGEHKELASGFAKAHRMY